ncbi:DUF5085 family protein [Streptococcus chenjunshii]|uniref:DUF5085 family protein n=1 Tax=Streptococcus chenjunshii TaxID=2173853 RepID=A0A372KJL3_9STRE|nr:DUF5085 family protein [Streptococcus chenjunshii]AXQ79401.1 DUF5085 family protein [Streptococcus chenjunshii]RFU50014.1 DUF5085 family protein [Streptococcus chenjunshii]RFU52196.1 DUF5085 family protein [Streptococcus chenjunshii]
MEYIVAQGVINEDLFEARNVIRKRKQFHVNQMREELDAFMTAVEAAGGHPAGPIVYSLNNVPQDGYMDIEFFLPLEEENIQVEGMTFSSYFEINNVIMASVDHNYEELTKEAYARLLWTLEQNGMDQNTPFYHILSTEGSGKVTVLLGYAY